MTPHVQGLELQLGELAMEHPLSVGLLLLLLLLLQRQRRPFVVMVATMVAAAALGEVKSNRPKMVKSKPTMREMNAPLPLKPATLPRRKMERSSPTPEKTKPQVGKTTLTEKNRPHR